MGSTAEGKRLPTWPGETSPRAVQPHRGLLAARPPPALGGRCPGLGPAGPAWHSGSLASHPGFGACQLVAGHHLSLPPPSLFSLFVLLKHASCYLAPGSAISKPASLFYKYFYSPFFCPGVGCQMGSRMNAARRERGAEEPGTEHVSRGVGLGRAV